ncbi:MAG TPA: VWA domain-containing protein [Pyrinomonadaceae bacterium]|jgi:VWFA-related protein|nr:VWA domain-containing protein [Pyrinomonadaceae bacterium]
MYKPFFFLVIIVLFSFTCFSQQPTTTLPDDQVVKINTNLIQIDVTVTDKDGKIVTGLKPEDFQLYENGELQKIANFSFVSKMASSATVSNGNSTLPTNSPRSDQIKQGKTGRTIALVVDDLNLSFASVYYTRKALNKFVDEQMLPTDLVAVIRTGGGVGALQQFTSNKQLLKAAIANIRWNPFSDINALTSVSQSDTEITERFTTESDQVASGNPKQYTLLHPHSNVDEIQEADKKAAKNAAAQEQGIYAQTSLGTVKYIISGMSKLPGRKAMMFFSDGISIGGESTKSRASTVFDYLQEVADAANRSSVVIYTFDTRGMQSMSIAASDNTYEIIDGHREQKVKERTKDFKDAQDGLVYFASQTGGKALLNSNDLNGGIERALEEQAGYYLLAYIPDADSFDASKRKFNKFEVKVDRPGLKVSYRSGFFNTDARNDVTPQLSAERKIADALMSPFAQNDIALNVNALYANDPIDGSYVRSFLHIDARSLKFSDIADGWKTATFDVAAVAFGNNGIPVDHVETTYTIKAKGPTFDAIQSNGFVYVLMLPVKKPGIYQYRVALRDSATDKIGTASQIVGIPDLTKQKLTISSLAVENVSMNTWQLITQGKVGNSTGQTQLKSTLLYDTVLRQFRPGTVLRYGFEVYDAKLDGTKNVRLEIQANILQSDKVVVQGNVNKFDTTDPASAVTPRVSGAMTLRDDIKPGEYALEINVTDTISKQTTKQLFPFSIN